jgi:hypothetical protein
MKLDNQVVLKLEELNKCHLTCDADCPLGQLYDFSCALQSFVMQKMKEAEEAKKQAQESKE